MLCPSSIALAERQKLSKSTWKAIDRVEILSRVAPILSIYIHNEAPSTQKPAVIFTASQTLESPALSTPGSPPVTKPDHEAHHTRFEHFSTSPVPGDLSAFQHFSLRHAQALADRLTRWRSRRAD